MVTSGVTLRYARATSMALVALLVLVVSVAPVLGAQQGAAAVAAATAAPQTTALTATALDLGGALVANGEAERYLRVLQLLGVVPQHPVGIRPWTRHELRTLTPTAEHPWAARFARPDSGKWRARFILLRPGARVTWNSSAAEGNDPIWFGRGATVDASAGVRFTLGPLDVQLAPTVSWAQNQGFDLAPNTMPGAGALRDARFPGNIDAPQRFGTVAFTRVDAGNSRVAVDTRFVSIGFSTEPLAWGPARDEPLVVGPNGGGFTHFFLGTGEPLPVGVGHVHLKMLAGRLEQSQWSPEQSGDRSRFGSGLVVTFVPRGVRGLEMGAVRFEHRTWSPGTATVRNALRPFTGILSDQTNSLNTGSENGYAAVFARWAVAPAGVEVYGEYGREDYAGNSRWLLLKPDDLGNLLLGVQRVMRRAGGGLRVVRVELVNGELSSNERGQRGFGAPMPPYLHSGGVLQGHTVNGRFLGSATAYGGAGWRVATDAYTPRGRRSVVVERALLRDWLPVAATAAGRSPEVRYTVRAEWLRFGARAQSRELGGTAGVSYTLNRNTVTRDDMVNVQVGVRWRGW